MRRICEKTSQCLKVGVSSVQYRDAFWPPMMPSNIYNPSSGIQFAWCRQRNHDRTARSLALSCVLYLISFGFISSRGITRCAPIEAMSSMALPAMFLIDIDEKEAAIVHVALDLFPKVVLALRISPVFALSFPLSTKTRGEG